MKTNGMKQCFLMGLATLAGVSSLTSCQQDEQQVPQSQAAITGQLQVRATIGSMGTSTRAVKTGTAFDAGDELGLFVTSSDGAALYNTTSGNIKATKVGTGWSLATSVSLSGTSAKVYAYYPYSASVKTDITGMKSIAVAPGETDYMWGISGEVNSSSPNADIQMKHALSCITFKLSNQGSPNACVLSNATLDNATSSVFYNTGTMDITSGAVALGTAGNLSYKQDSNFKNSTVSISNIVLPYAKDIAEGDCKFTFTIDGKTYTYKVPALKDGYKAGYRYTYTFVMKGSELVIDDDADGGITITPWEDGGEVGSGVFE